jgi:hypothetical protein
MELGSVEIAMAQTLQPENCQSSHNKGRKNTEDEKEQSQESEIPKEETIKKKKDKN